MMPVATKMSCEVVGGDNITSLASRVFSTGKRDDQVHVMTKEPDHNTTFTVRITRIQKRLGSIMPYVIEGEILEADGRAWESFSAYFLMTANHALVGTCSIGEFPDDMNP